LWLALGLSALLVACSSNPPVPNETPHNGEQQARTQHPAVAVATGLLGTPYRYGGTSPRGFDCSGLVYYAYRQAGVSVPRTTQAQRRHAKPVELAGIQPGDLLFFKHGFRGVSHVGIYTGNQHFIHAPSSGKQVTYASLDNPYWENRLIAAGRYYP
jgi:cell wall-associated NlpC family hydrolase